jgi:hypothetical protein
LGVFRKNTVLDLEKWNIANYYICYFLPEAN